MAYLAYIDFGNNALVSDAAAMYISDAVNCFEKTHFLELLRIFGFGVTNRFSHFFHFLHYEHEVKDRCIILRCIVNHNHEITSFKSAHLLGKY